MRKLLALLAVALLLFGLAVGVAPAQQPAPGPPAPPVLVVPPVVIVPPAVVPAAPLSPGCMTLPQWIRYNQAWRDLARYRFHKTLAERR